jgi:hypothetical protein
MVNKCIQCGITYSTECKECVSKCNNCSNSKCTTYFDTNCVYYNYNQPYKYSELTCLGIKSDTNLTTILKAIDSRMCTPILLQDTYTVSLSWDINNALTADVRIDPASTIPYSIGPAGIKIDCCDPTQICNDVVYDIDYTFGDITKIGSFYNVFQDDYFTKSQYLTTVKLTGNTIMTGAGLSFIKYNNYLTNTVALKNTLLGTFDFPLDICAQSIIGKSSQMTVELGTTPYCKFFETCKLSVERVPHSETFYNMSIFNPQMEQESIYNNVLYFVENANNNLTVSSQIRKWDIITNEVVTISGTNFANGTLINNSFGNTVEYVGLTSLILDSTDLYINEPAIYTVTMNGCVCRVIKNNSNLCDERSNWITYIIAGADQAPANISNTTGDLARFQNPNGIKQLGVYNNAPILLISDRDNHSLKLVYFLGGNRNSSLDWYVSTIPTNADPILNSFSGVAFHGSAYANINFDRTLNELFTFYEYNGDSFVSIAKFTGNPNLPSAYLNGANYTNVYALKAAVSNGALLQNGSDGSSAEVGNMFFLNKIVINNQVWYVYCEMNSTISSVYLNGFKKLTSSPATLNDFEYHQFIQNNTIAPGTIGAFNPTGSANCYGFITLNNGDIVDYGPGGFRLWDFDTDTIVSVLCGETDNTYSQTQLTLVNNNYTDTQYKFLLEC